ncbi:MAG: hypothetical protein VB024_11625 [Dysgonamonadaceae bacterium]|nr:hypothetical protein [Dysgonamonadaceae bacterium]
MIEQEKSPATEQGDLSERQNKYTNYFANNQIFGESFESQKLQNLINEKKEFLKKQTKDFAKKKLQEEILFLEKDVLPILFRETTILYSEIVKYVTGKTQQAVKMECDAMLCLIPLTDKISENYVIGIANPKELTVYGKIDEFDVAIEQMNRDMKIQITNLPL